MKEESLDLIEPNIQNTTIISISSSHKGPYQTIFIVPLHRDYVIGNITSLENPGKTFQDKLESSVLHKKNEELYSIEWVRLDIALDNRTRTTNNLRHTLSELRDRLP